MIKYNEVKIWIQGSQGMKVQGCYKGLNIDIKYFIRYFLFKLNFQIKSGPFSVML